LLIGEASPRKTASARAHLHVLGWFLFWNDLAGLPIVRVCQFLPDSAHPAEYFQRFPKERYQTEVESWRHLQSQNIEFTMKRLREPIEGGG